MAVRQYIGARYVPTYYQNSLDPTSSEWEANVNYDPLTIVSLPNMHSYQSKKFVPSTVGSPASNPEYWYDQGYASAYYQALQDQIDEMNDGSINGSLQNQIDAHASDLADLENQINRQFILVGDSYVDTPTTAQGYPKYLRDYTGRTEGTDFFTTGIGGACFGGTPNFLDLLTALTPTIPDVNKITDILVCGGINDRNNTASSIVSGISAFVTYAKANYPNAKIHIACISWCRINGDTFKYFDVVVANYKKACNLVDCDYVSNSEYIFNDYSQLAADDMHPIASGSQQIARGLANWIKNGNVTNERSWQYVSITPASIISSGTIGEFEFNEGDHVVIDFPQTSITFGSAQNAGDITLGTIATPKFVKGELTFLSMVAACIVNDGTAKNIPCCFYIQNGALHWRNPLNNVTSLTWYEISFIANKTVC